MMAGTFSKKWKAGSSSSSGRVEHATRFIEEELAGTVQESFGTRLIGFVPPRDDRTLATVFRLLEEHCEALSISDYSVSQPTMEQIFLGFAQEDGDDEEDGDD